jgi:hypothetical protein
MGVWPMMVCKMSNLINQPELVEQLIEDAAHYLINNTNKTYADWVADNQHALAPLISGARHPYDLIGKITADAVITAQLLTIHVEIDSLESAITELDAQAEESVEPSKTALKKRLAQSHAARNRQEAMVKIHFKLFDYIIANNIAHVLTEEKIYYQGFNKPCGTTFTPVRERVFFDSHPLLFAPDALQQKLGITSKDIEAKFRELLEHTHRHKDGTTVTFKVPPVELYNKAPDPQRWIKPRFDLHHHEFFDVLFTCLAPDPLARKNLLDSLAFKYVYPFLNRLASPIFVGVGGVGKTLVGELLDAIFGTQCINWKARLNDDTMKNTGSLFEGRLVIHFDEMVPLSNNSLGYLFLKDNLHTHALKIRNLHQKMSDIENASWVWFSGNRNHGDVSPVPLMGDGATGIDRRFTPIITRVKMVDYVQKIKSLSQQDAEVWIDRMIQTVMKNEQEIAKFLGHIILQSNVLNLTENDYPRAYHGPDYEELVGCHNPEIQSLAEYVYDKKTPFIKLADAYAAYQLLCNQTGVEKRYRKLRKNFQEDFTKALASYFPNASYGKHNLRTGGFNTGWKLIPASKNPDGRFQLTYIDSHGHASLNEEYMDLLERDAALAKATMTDDGDSVVITGSAAEAACQSPEMSVEDDSENIGYQYPSQYLIAQLPETLAYSPKANALLAMVRAASDPLYEEDRGSRAP